MSQANRVIGTDSVSYLRVSDTSQVKTDYDPEGNSIPAQREANKVRARDVDSVIIEEFVDPGRTGTSMEKRPEFQAMLAYVREHPNVKYVIVYALSRFARNRYDDAVLMMSLDKLGVTLLSATERNLDNTPAGKAMHGMIAVFNQYQSDANGEDIKYKMGQKVKAKGGALSAAPVGYRNVRDFSEGREIRTIGLDHERDRVPLIRECFELYATGDYTIDSVTRVMVERGLTMRASANQAGTTCQQERYRPPAPRQILHRRSQVQGPMVSRSARDVHRQRTVRPGAAGTRQSQRRWCAQAPPRPLP